MDVVVRTPHGDADVEIVAVPAATTLADLVSAVTGQAAPSTARVDGRTVSTARPVTDLDLAIGSTIDTNPVVAATVDPVDTTAGDTSVGLLQLTGRGAGSVSRLRHGRYRIGSARRLRAPEMVRSPVETPAFELDVGDDGSVRISPGAGRDHNGGRTLGLSTPMLDGEPVDRGVEWTHGRLRVGNRVFELERPCATIERRRLPAPAPDGSIAFHRPPVVGGGERPLMVGARRTAVSVGEGLWQRRRDDPGAFTIPFGIDRTGRTTMSIDLAQHRGVALVGSEHFAAGLARSLLTEATTMHGPADLGVVVASTADRVAQWSWARWLPHVHSGGPGTDADIFGDRASLTAWANSIQRHVTGAGDDAARPDAARSDVVASDSAVPGTARPETAVPDPSVPDTAASGNGHRADSPSSWQPPSAPMSQPRLTVLVIDDLALWSRRDSPIRSLLTDPPPELRIFALCGGMHEAPGLCTTLIEEVTPQALLTRAEATGDASGHRAGDRSAALLGSVADLHIRTGRSSEVITDIRPALVETSIADEVARSMAALDDIESHQRVSPPTRIAAPTLTELLGRADPTAERARLPVAIGVAVTSAASPSPAERRPIVVDVSDPRPAVLAVHDARQHDLTVAAVVFGVAARRRPDELAVLMVGHDRPSWTGDLAHVAGWVDHSDADDPARLIHRVAHVLTERPVLELVVVVEHAFVDPAENARDVATIRDEGAALAIVTGMYELAASLPNVHLVLTTRDAGTIPDRLAAGDAVIAQISEDGSGILRRRGHTQHFIGIDAATGMRDPSFEPRSLVIRPAARGRTMSPLERRLSRSAVSDRVDGRDEVMMSNVAHEVARRSLAIGRGSGSIAGSGSGSIAGSGSGSIAGSGSGSIAGSGSGSIAGSGSDVAGVDLLPPPLPDAVEAMGLLRRHAGDGIPIGLVDRPERAENEVYWWQPGSGGSILAVGSPRSAMTSLLDLVITGIAARLSADDLHVYAVEALPQRRRSLDALPHTGGVVTPDDPVGATTMIAALHGILRERQAVRDRHVKSAGHVRSRSDQPDLLLLIGDVSRLRRSLAGGVVDVGHEATGESSATDTDDTFELLADLAASGASVGINVILIANRASDVGRLIALTGDRLVGALPDHDDRVRLGVPAVGPSDRHVGRCWSTAADRRMQLATPPDSVEHEIALLEPEQPRNRQPVRFSSTRAS